MLDELTVLPEGASTEFLPVGKSVLVHRTNNGASAVLDPIAADIWSCTIAGEDPQSIVARLQGQLKISSCAAADFVSQVFVCLEAAGFRDEAAAVRQALESTTETREQTPITLPQDAILNVGWHMDHSVQILFHDTELRDIIAAVLSTLCVPAGASVRSFTTIEVTCEQRGITICRDGVIIADGCSRSLARRVIIQSVMVALTDARDIAAILHASAVEKEGRCIILSGVSGSGKTTLMMHLIASGGTYFCDDFTALAPSGRQVSSFPLAASIKSDSWQILQKNFRDLSAAPIFDFGERRVRYLPVEPPNSGPRAAKPSLVIFPQYRQGVPLFCARLSPENSLARFIASGSEMIGRPRSMMPFVELANHTPAFELVYGATDEAEAAIDDLLAQANA